MAGDESDHLQRRRKIRLPTRCRRHREHHHERRSGSTSLERKAQSRCADSDFWRHGAGVDWPVGGSFDSGTHPSAGSTGERRLHEVLLLPSSSQAQRCCQCGTTGNRPKSISSTILGTAVRILGTKRPEPEGSGQHDRNNNRSLGIRHPSDRRRFRAVGCFCPVRRISAERIHRSVFSALACFGDLPDEERQILFETFQVWQDTDASVGVAA